MAAQKTTGIALITGVSELNPIKSHDKRDTYWNPTQGASGIGRETGYSFAEAGALGIVFADINITGAQEAAEDSKKLATNPKYRPLAIQVDVTKPESVLAMVEQTVKEFGRIDYSVNSAGVSWLIIYKIRLIQHYRTI